MLVLRSRTSVDPAVVGAADAAGAAVAGAAVAVGAVDPPQAVISPSSIISASTMTNVFFIFLSPFYLRIESYKSIFLLYDNSFAQCPDNRISPSPKD